VCTMTERSEHAADADLPCDPYPYGEPGRARTLDRPLSILCARQGISLTICTMHEVRPDSGTSAKPEQDDCQGRTIMSGQGAGLRRLAAPGSGWSRRPDDEGSAPHLHQYLRARKPHADTRGAMKNIEGRSGERRNAKESRVTTLLRRVIRNPRGTYAAAQSRMVIDSGRRENSSSRSPRSRTSPGPAPDMPPRRPGADHARAAPERQDRQNMSGISAATDNLRSVAIDGAAPDRIITPGTQESGGRGMTATKRCTGCGEVKPLEEFRR